MSQLEEAIKLLEFAPKVNIRGKQYTQVAARVEAFRRVFGHEYCLTTEILDAPEPLVRVRAIISTLAGAQIATGLAEENRESGPINRTSALENCETSAIGRCLANWGLHGGEFASAGEVENAIAQQGSKQPSQPSQPAIMSGVHKTKTALRDALQALMADIMDDEIVSDEQTLDGLLADNMSTINQVMTDVPTWWHGKEGSDQLGMEERIKNRRDDLRQKGSNHAI